MCDQTFVRRALRRPWRALLMALVLVAGGVLLPAHPASAAGCRTWDTSATWGKAWICVEYRTVNYSSYDFEAYHVFGQIMDTKTDGKCVDLYAHTGKTAWSGTNQKDHWAPRACTLNRAVSFDFTIAKDEWAFCGARLVRGVAGNWDNFNTVWNNPYWRCDGW